MENGDIPDENIKASGRFKWEDELDCCYPWFARLNGVKPWVGEGTPPNVWIQADIGYQTYVSGVVTQGSGDILNSGDWVSSIKVSTFYGSTNDDEVFVKDEQGEAIVSKTSL